MLYTGIMTGPVSLPFPPKDITSGFNPNRKVLINGKWVTHSHTGTDFAPSYKGGEPIPAILDGTLTGWGNNHSLYGNWAEYTGAGGWKFRVHGRKETFKPPQTVKAGDTVGTIYQPGASNGIHVHYELYKDNKAVDMAKVVGWSPEKLHPTVESTNKPSLTEKLGLELPKIVRVTNPKNGTIALLSGFGARVYKDFSGGEAYSIGVNTKAYGEVTGLTEDEVATLVREDDNRGNDLVTKILSGINKK